MNPVVDILIKAYNIEEFIGQAIESALMQETNFPYRILINDDNSSDNTAQLIKQYANDNTIITAFYQQKNLGAGQSSIFLFGQASAKYIAILDGDDYWTDPDKLQKQVDFLEKNPEFNACFHDAKFLTTESKLTDNPISPPAETSTLKDLALENYIPPLCVVYRNENTINSLSPLFLQTVIGNTVCDYVFHFLFIKNGKIKFFNDVMGIYRLRPNSITREKPLDERYFDILTTIKSIFDNIELPEEVKDNLIQHFRYNRNESINYSIHNNLPLKPEAIKLFQSFDGEFLLSSFYDELKSSRTIVSSRIYDSFWLAKTIPITSLLKAVLKKFRIR